jgi:serine/threonine protein kinase
MGGSAATEKYRLGDRIGGGGMAEVFEATLVGVAGFERPVAVKRMLPSLSSDPTFGDMFINEARIASLLHHANIVTVLDFDRDAEGRFFLVMELIRGMDLRQLSDSGLLPIDVAVHIACEMLRGLDYAHELEHDGKRLGIVHRDISPHNVMISWDGQVKLVDFGIAKAVAATGVSRSGTLKGKLAYMSPEQAGAVELDGRSDVFAVGIVLHELIAGERLFRGSTEPEVLARVLTQPIPRPGEKRAGVPPAIDDAVMGMLERDRDRRLASAHHALEVLLATASARGGLELERLLSDRFPDRARKRRPASAASGASGQPIATPTDPTAVPDTPSGSPPPPAPPPQSAAGDETLPARPASLKTLTAPPVAAISPPREQVRPWRAGLLVALLAAAATAGALLLYNTRGAEGERAANEPSLSMPADAAARMIAPPPAADAAPPAAPPDAAPLPQKSAPASHKEKEREPGLLEVRVEPWAEVSVDGKKYVPTPADIKLSPGTHRVSLRNKEAGKSENVPVTIRSGRTTPIHRDWN